MRSWVILFITIALVGCNAPVPSPEEALGTSPLPGDPVLTRVTYAEDGLPVTKTPPLSSFQVINPDYATGSCTGTNAEVQIEGTFDAGGTDTLTVSGGSSIVATTSGNSFLVKLCVAQGATSIQIRANNASGSSSPNPLLLSLNSKVKWKTLGYGHPKYPTPGFRVAAASKPQSTTGSVVLQHVQMEATSAQRINSVGAAGLTMDVGFVQVLKQSNP